MKPWAHRALNYFYCHQDLLLTRIFSLLFDLEILESAEARDALGVGKSQPESAAGPVDTQTCT